MTVGEPFFFIKDHKMGIKKTLLKDLLTILSILLREIIEWGIEKKRNFQIFHVYDGTLGQIKGVSP